MKEKKEFDVSSELYEFDKETSKKKFSKLIRFLKLLAILIIITIWYFYINMLETNINNYKILGLLIYVGINYFLFNILVFGHLQINYDIKPKVKEVRKDVKIVINICKILTIINILIITLFSYNIYKNKSIIDCMIYFLPLCGFNLLFYNLTSSLENSIIKHEKIEISTIILGVLFIVIGIIIYIYNNPFAILKLINT